MVGNRHLVKLPLDASWSKEISEVCLGIFSDGVKFFVRLGRPFEVGQPFLLGRLVGFFVRAQLVMTAVRHVLALNFAGKFGPASAAVLWPVEGTLPIEGLLQLGILVLLLLAGRLVLLLPLSIALLADEAHGGRCV